MVSMRAQRLIHIFQNFAFLGYDTLNVTVGRLVLAPKFIHPADDYSAEGFARLFADEHFHKIPRYAWSLLSNLNRRSMFNFRT